MDPVLDTAASGLPDEVCIIRSLSPAPPLLQRPCRATEQQLQAYHTPEYVAYLRQARTDHNPKNWDDQSNSQAHPDHKRFNFGEDCPAFDGLFNFCQLYAGGHLLCANGQCFSARQQGLGAGCVVEMALSQL